MRLPPPSAADRFGFRRAIRTGIVLSGLLLLVWEIAVRLLQVHPTALPSPTRLLLEITRDGRALGMHARVTALEALQGCLLALACAVLLVVLHTAFRGLRRVTSPAFAVLEMLPLVASVPLFFIWFGFGNGPAIATAFLLCFPALASCLQSGTDQAPRELLEILEAAGIPTAKTFWKIQLPACLPFLSIGLKRCIPLALAGATVAEFVASNSGLGSRMLFAASRTETTPLFASLTVLIIMACGSYGLLLLIERGIIGWLGPGADWKKWGGTRHPNQRSASNDE